MPGRLIPSVATLVSPFRASRCRAFRRLGVGPSVEATCYSMGCASSVCYRSCRAERRGVETSPRIRAAPFRHASLRRGFSTSPLPRSGLWSKRPGFFGNGLHPPLQVMSSERSESRHLLGCAGSDRGCWCRGGLSTSGRRGPPVETTWWSVERAVFYETCLSPPPSGHVERNAGSNARAGGTEVVRCVPSCQDTAPPRQSHVSKNGGRILGRFSTPGSSLPSRHTCAPCFKNKQLQDEAQRGPWSRPGRPPMLCACRVTQMPGPQIPPFPHPPTRHSSLR